MGNLPVPFTVVVTSNVVVCVIKIVSLCVMVEATGVFISELAPSVFSFLAGYITSVTKMVVLWTTVVGSSVVVTNRVPLDVIVTCFEYSLAFCTTRRSH